MAPIVLRLPAARGCGRVLLATAAACAGLALSFLFAAGGAHAKAPDDWGCMNGLITIEGTPGDDVLRGTHGSDVIHGHGGNDTIVGRYGKSDVVCGGGGDDVITADGVIAGGPGDDTITGDGKQIGGPGDDELAEGKIVWGGRGDDVLIGDSGANRFSPGPGDDTIDGIHNDWDRSKPCPPHDILYYRRAPRAVRVDSDLGLVTGWGHDRFVHLHRVIGSRFDDVMLGASGAHDTLEGFVGDDVLGGRSGDDELEGGEGDDVLVGGEGADELRGEDGDDDLSGGDGRDELYTSAGDDRFDGGAHIDVVDFQCFCSSKSKDAAPTPPRGIRVDLGLGVASGDGSDLLVEIEKIIGSEYRDVLLGSDGDDRLSGEGGPDLVLGRAGDDYVRANAVKAFDEYRGGAGRDTISFQWIYRRVFIDLDLGTTFALTRNRYRLRSVDLERRLRTQARGPGPRFGDRLAGFEAVIGSDEPDFIRGDRSADTLIGGDGSDRIEGRSGDDYLVGGADDDRLRGGAGDDALIGDCRRLRYEEESDYDGECTDSEDDVLLAGSGDDLLIGDCAFAEYAFATCYDAPVDSLRGGAGTDVVTECVDATRRKDPFFSSGNRGPKLEADERTGIEVEKPCTFEVSPPL